MITVNEFVEELEEIWNKLEWGRKFERVIPEEDIKYVFHAYSREEVDQAREILGVLEEEGTDENGDEVWRAAHLASYSSGEAIVITESVWDDDY